MLVGLGVFAAGSLAGSMATTPAQLIAARAVMGIGAAGIFPSTLSLLANVFTNRAERAKAIGLWGATTGVGIAAGPIIGGWLLEHLWWGSVFLFMVPVAAAIAGFVAYAVPTSKDPAAPPIDGRGLLLSTAGMALLIFRIIQAPDWGWGSSRTLATMAAGIFIFAVFVGVECRTARPMLEVGLFRDLRFTAASGSITIGFFTLAGFTFLITQYFQFVKDYSPLGTGVRLLPVATSVGVASILGTKLAVRIGNKAVVASGLLLFGGTLLWIAEVASQSTSYGIIATQTVLGGSGLGLISAPATEATMGAVPKEKAGVASAVSPLAVREPARHRDSCRHTDERCSRSREFRRRRASRCAAPRRRGTHWRWPHRQRCDDRRVPPQLFRRLASRRCRLDRRFHHRHSLPTRATQDAR